MKIAIISDTHDHLDMIRLAVRKMQEKKVEMVIHCGDFIAPFAIPPFGQLNVPFIAVYGNNDGEKKGLAEKIFNIGGMVCYPPLVRDVDNTKFLICHEPIPEENVKKYFSDVTYYLFGHTHEAVEKELNGIKIINPGEACGWLTRRATFAILDTHTRKVEFITL